MPLAVYKKLKGHNCTLSDLEVLEPALVHGLVREFLPAPVFCEHLGV
jgi:hypothetical protein